MGETDGREALERGQTEPRDKQAWPASRSLTQGRGTWGHLGDGNPSRGGGRRGDMEARLGPKDGGTGVGGLGMCRGEGQGGSWACR